MANTINLGKAPGQATGRGKRRFGGRFSRAFVLAAIATVVLGLAALATFTRVRPAAVPAAAPAPPVNPNSVDSPFASDPHVYTVWDFREDCRDDGSAIQLSAPAAPAGPADWEQQERTQVAPSTAPSPSILPGDCQPGTSDCPPVNYTAPVAPGALPIAPTILPGDCQQGTSDCAPPDRYTPVGPPPGDYPPGGPR